MAELILAEGIAPGAPSSGKVSLYAKTDGLLYSKDALGLEIPVSTSGIGTLSFYAAVPTDTTIPLIASVRFRLRIDSINNLVMTSGSCNIVVQINGIDVTGIDGIPVTTTPQDVITTDNNIAQIGQRITLIIFGSSSPVGLEFSLQITRL